MKLMVDFEKRKAGASANESWDIPSELMPLISEYAWKPKKGDAVMDFIAELSECETECEFTCDDANVKCMAVVDCQRAWDKRYRYAKQKLGRTNSGRSYIVKKSTYD